MAIGDLLDEVTKYIEKPVAASDNDDDIIKVAVVSDQVENLANKRNIRGRKVIVSDIPGTTRDAIGYVF